ncbi:H-NS histone family protein [Chromatium okenii]|uniref:H-NS histone family protein n=1 Tax=Chromatium okenii TaxID=61644 RepID=A0A2S7XP25_9GAMM|nr:H-NS histone family protein [Chromatium okenii]PQJ95323.1 H-NS histone family protein [Chromatium okenii]
MEYANLSLEELKRLRDETENRQAELNRLLEERRQAGKDNVIQQIRDIIEGNGYSYDDITPFIAPKKRRGRGPAKKHSTATRQYTHYVDPENAKHIYVRGVLPRWMKQKMQEQGYDPRSKADREVFKANSLKAVLV